jgi:hypothetical protein
LQDAFKQMAEMLETVDKHGRGLHRGWWWPVGPKLVFTRWQHQYQKLWVPLIFVQSYQNKRKHCDTAGRPAPYFSLPLLPSASPSWSIPEEVLLKLCSEPLLKYLLSFYGLKPIFN